MLVSCVSAGGEICHLVGIRYSVNVVSSWQPDLRIGTYPGWDRFGSVRFRFPGTGEFPVPGSVRFGSSGYNLKNGSVRFGFWFLTGLVSGS